MVCRIVDYHGKVESKQELNMHQNMLSLEGQRDI
jgi:hypothetical protein